MGLKAILNKISEFHWELEEEDEDFAGCYFNSWRTILVGKSQEYKRLNKRFLFQVEDLGLAGRNAFHVLPQKKNYDFVQFGESFFTQKFLVQIRKIFLQVGDKPVKISVGMGGNPSYPLFFEGIQIFAILAPCAEHIDDDDEENIPYEEEEGLYDAYDDPLF